MKLRLWALMASILFILACGTDDTSGGGNVDENNMVSTDAGNNSTSPNTGNSGNADAGNNVTSPDMGEPRVPREAFSISGGSSISSSSNHKARIVIGGPQPVSSTSSSDQHRLNLGPNAERP